MSKLIKLRNIKQALRVKPNNGNRYSIGGRVQSFRSFKAFNFIDLVDGSTNGKLQAIVRKELIQKPDIGAYLRCQGQITPSSGPNQPLEFKVDALDYLGVCSPTTYPLVSLVNMSDLTEDLMRQHVHLRPRFSHFASMLRIRSELELSLHMIMKQMEFFKVQPPCLTSNDSEASSDLFQVQRTKTNNSEPNAERIIKDNYFGKEVYLTTSAQMHLESLAASLSRVYCMTTAFRAENSLTRRHLCEFQMFEAEESGVNDLDSLMNRVESIIKFTAQFLSLVSDHQSDMQNLLKIHEYNKAFELLAHKPYIRMDYQEALDILKDKTDFEGDTSFGSDIGTVQEKKLLEFCDHVPIFIKNYPKSLKPFYMKTSQQDERLVDCFDLIAPVGGEICGGSLREESVDRLTDNLKQNGIDADKFDWYLDLRRFGTFPHGGFGIGMERLIQSLTGTKNIKDTVPFPRWSGHCQT